ncbi:unnamed protein product [Chilo suppressalis]|uniref:FLYWCH-type domain-containing protein n=1 Tax=Chilo suppressalis TaxID=168631 RepID=A0ABN8AZV7_CHISP|nr:unnamed protein product [Chilo suppressalis]
MGGYWYRLEVPAVYVPSRTGKSLLLHDGYTFYLKNLQAHGRKQWYCSSRDMAGCRADVITAPANTGNGDVLFLVRGRHIHGPPNYYFTPDGKYVRRKDIYHSVVLGVKSGADANLHAGVAVSQGLLGARPFLLHQRLRQGVLRLFAKNTSSQQIEA